MLLTLWRCGCGVQFVQVLALRPRKRRVLAFLASRKLKKAAFLRPHHLESALAAATLLVADLPRLEPETSTALWEVASASSLL